MFRCAFGTVAILIALAAMLNGQQPIVERLPAPTPVAPAPTAKPSSSSSRVVPIYSSPGAHQRAGWPQQVHKWAIPSDTGSHVGYYVGGSAGGVHGGPRYPHEGTWGWDYRGRLLPRRIILGWSHGRLYQGGSGAYRTDGPTTNHGEHGDHE